MQEFFIAAVCMAICFGVVLASVRTGKGVINNISRTLAFLFVVCLLAMPAEAGRTRTFSRGFGAGRNNQQGLTINNFGNGGGGGGFNQFRGGGGGCNQNFNAFRGNSNFRGNGGGGGPTIVNNFGNGY